ncbi:ComEA family DNA-binding protein [Trichloromonas sp.]|uniref:ComEA family DNA-binding protein n=1 Tax=Trichloromonas sp. TaxID=3069249 RepID=UPI002A3D46FF|nr:ComEA family DNA-binding protein [Trichloromonas sp.]
MKNFWRLVIIGMLLTFTLSGTEVFAVPQAATAQKAVNINSATLEQLEALPGVGPVSAQRIIDYREKNGPFKSVEQLVDVKGIGEKSLAKFRGQVAVK